MATMNPFELLGNDDNDDPSQLIAAAAAAQPAKAEKPTKKAVTAPAQGANKPAAKLPSKPLPPSEAVREARNEGGRGGGRGGGYGRGSGGGGYGRGGYERGPRRDFGNDDNAEGNNGFPERVNNKPSEEGEKGKSFDRRGGPRGPYRGGRPRGDFGNEGGEGERRRPYERRSGTGRGNELKRDGSGRGNWGSPTDEIAPEIEEAVVDNEKAVVADKQPGEEEAVDANKESPEIEPEEKEPEEKEMTLEEYEKVLEEKRKALVALRAEERKVDLDKDLQSMLQLSNKKKSNDDEIFIKLGSDKEKRKDAADKEEKSKKSISINSFLKPAEGETYYGGGRGGRGRGRGRGPRGGGNNYNSAPAQSVGDIGSTMEFPSLGAK